ncbi:MAG: 3-phosphoshikimate 1-carboxyvinyltransferase [Nevskiales bacterium]
MSQRIDFLARRGGELKGRVDVPGDKSVSHRSIMLGALANGTTHVQNFLTGEDCLATLRAFRAMGVNIQQPQASEVIIHGVGMHGLQAPEQVLDVGNSGTSMRLMAGLLSAQAFDSELTGDASLQRRPMGRVIDPLQAMGARIESQEGRAPLRIQGGQALQGLEYAMPVASAQIKSCLLLAGMYAQGRTVVIEPGPSRDHSERMLRAFGYELTQAEDKVSLQGGGALQASDITVPNDISSATFFMLGAAIVPGSELLLPRVGVNPTRTGVIDILRLMGAEVLLESPTEQGGEPVADIRVRGAELQGIEIPPELVPLAIDEFPAVFIAAACAQGETLLTEAAELRVKESDRIQVMADGLQALGITAEPRADGIRIVGGQIQGGRVQSHGDHRIAMSFAMAALRAAGDIYIEDCANVDTSFPGFASLANSAGMCIETTGMDA